MKCEKVFQFFHHFTVILRDIIFFLNVKKLKSFFSFLPIDSVSYVRRF